MRAEQADAVEKTHAYFDSIWNEDRHAVPRFLWNAKMRFGKTFASYQLAKTLGAKKVLVVTFKPAVEDAWQTDLESHVDFDGWQYLSKANGGDPTKADKKRPLVYFGSFQDLLGRDKDGQHQGQERVAPRDQLGSRDLRRVPLRRVARQRQGAVRGRGRRGRQEGTRGRVRDRCSTTFDEELEELRETRSDFLPITTRRTCTCRARHSRRWRRASSSRSRSSTGPTPTSSAPSSSSLPTTRTAGTPTRRLPEMRLFTYQMPDELIAIASQGEFDEFDLNAFFEATGTGAMAEFKHKDDVQKWLDIIRGLHHPTQVDASKLGHPAAVPVLRRAAAAVPAALVLVPAERRRVPRDGEPAC